MSYWANKDELQAKAKRDTIDRERTDSKGIEWCCTHTAYENGENYKNRLDTMKDFPDRFKEPQVILVNEKTHEAAMNYHDGQTCILNFASFKNPGGRYIDGSSAQEESLCHNSFLYNVLKKFPAWYESNKSKLNRALYKDLGLYTPEVKFYTDTKEYAFDVFTCAAPNRGVYLRYNPGKENADYADSVLLDRMEFVINVMEDHHVDTAILGAYGCGVFKNNPKTVAEYWHSLLKKTAIKKIVFAVYDTKGENGETYKAFDNVVKNW